MVLIGLAGSIIIVGIRIAAIILRKQGKSFGKAFIRGPTSGITRKGTGAGSVIGTGLSSRDRTGPADEVPQGWNFNGGGFLSGQVQISSNFRKKLLRNKRLFPVSDSLR